MAHSTLPVFRSPAFPQVFAAALTQEVTRVSAHPQLSLCCYVSPVIGIADGGYECKEPAVVHHVATEQDYCARHYREVGRG